MGINFFFNYMNEINKMKFQESAPDFREASDGMNILFYCENGNCKINKEMFIHKLGKLIKLIILVFILGFGKFEIIEKIKNINCPICLTNKISPRTFGFVNCKWMYRVNFLDKKETQNSGDGITIDKNIYILNEIDMKKSIKKLDILIQEKDPSNIDSTKSKFKKRPAEQSDYDSVGLVCDHPSRRNKSKIEFDGYLNSTIKSKHIKWEFLNKFGIKLLLWLKHIELTRCRVSVLQVKHI